MTPTEQEGNNALQSTATAREGATDLSQTTTYAIIHSVVTGQIGDAERPAFRIPRLFVTGVPADCTREQLQGIIMEAGLFYGDSGVPWGNNSLVREESWGHINLEILHDDLKKGKVETVSYETLLAWAKNPRRITLRMPPGLHASLVSLARSRGLSLNQIIVGALISWRDNEEQISYQDAEHRSIMPT